MTSSMHYDRSIFGLALKPMTVAEAFIHLDDAIEAKQPTPLAIMNAYTAVTVREHPRLRAALERFTVFNDGIGMDIFSVLKYGTKFPENLNGTDLIPAYLKNSRHDLRIYLLGATQPVVEQAARVLQERFPRHKIVGYRNGYFSADQNSQITSAIRDSRATLLLVAMGNPLQELWIAEHYQETGVLLAVGIGALFDFIANRVPRAPHIVRLLRAEWLFRLICEPRRLWKRYTVGSLKFMFHGCLEALTYRRGRQT